MPKGVYAFRNSAKNVQNATSGGAFFALAEAFFEFYADRQGHVYGCTYDNHMNVCYDVAKTLEDCKKFSGSKYVRSDITGVFEHIQEDLIREHAVLFTGLPCQVAALRKYISDKKISQDNLICIDLICHGAPKPSYWQAYREWLEKKYKSKMVDFKFRTHGKGSSSYSCLATFQDGKKYANTLETQVYNRMFLRHYLFFEGCFKCPFANLDRRGDLTIGDFWGVEAVMPDYPYKKDVSEILVNTPNGEKFIYILMEKAQAKGYCISQCHSEEYIKYQNNLQKPANKPDDFDEFQKDFQERGFSYIAKKYVGYDILHRIKFFLFKK